MGLVWVEVVVRNPDTGRHAGAKALVDTGATVTVVPRRIAARSRCKPNAATVCPQMAAGASWSSIG